MKVILLFALFGGSCSSSGSETFPSSCPVSPSKNPEAIDCLIFALEATIQGFVTEADFICAYQRFQVDKNWENYKKSASYFIILGYCTGCLIDYILGTGSKWEDFSGEFAKDSKVLDRLIGKLLFALGLDQFSAKATCAVVGPLLASEHSKNALQNANIGILTALNVLYCEADEILAEDSAFQFVELLKLLEIPIEEQFGFNENTLVENLASLGERRIKILIKYFLELHGSFDLGSDSACPGIGVKLEDKQLV